MPHTRNPRVYALSWLSMQNSLDLRANFDNQRVSPTMTHWILPIDGNPKP